MARSLNYLHTHRLRNRRSQVEVAILLDAFSGTKAVRYENFTSDPNALTTLTRGTLFRQPASELSAGTYDVIETPVQGPTRHTLKRLEGRPVAGIHETFRELNVLHALVEAKTNSARLS